MVFTAFILSMLCGPAPALQEPATTPERMSLAGTWRCRLDPDDVGVEQRWFAGPLAGSPIALPGTTDLAGLGPPLDRESMSYGVPLVEGEWPGTAGVERADELGHLVREHHYLGRAWFQREIEIPAAWAGAPGALLLERVLWQSQVWLDDIPLGVRDSLAAPHRYLLGPLRPGKHRLTICVDNRQIHDIGVYGHSYGPETQSRWNGVVGRIELERLDRLRRIEVHPAADARSVRAVVELWSDEALPRTLPLELTVSTMAGEVLGRWRQRVTMAPGQTVLAQAVELAAAAEVWDEFSPVLHRLSARLDDGPEMTETFGFRHLERDGRALRINGRRLFLRGNLDCCVYPRTGHPPTSVEEWRRVLGVVQEHGFNHVRFHTWCPPEAAFVAADELGLYLQPETAWWVDNWIAATEGGPPLPGRDAAVDAFVAAEIRRIAEAYGNHPSFALFCIGNEFGMASDWATLDGLIAEAKRRDPRRLYNAATARKRVASDDFWVTHRTEAASARGIGSAHTDWDFAAAVADSPVAVVGHETGQRPVFPDFPALLPKFDGPLQPHNLARLQRRLGASGLADQLPDFVRASARFQAALYQSEHEAMLRTPGYGGYQLLMLNDFPGQSQAHVGFLDPFFESKGVYGAKELRRWNAPTVPLARFSKYNWSTDEVFRAELEVAHFGPRSLEQVQAEWSLSTASGDRLGGGELAPRSLPTGAVTPLGAIEMPLDGLDGPARLELRARVREFENTWSLFAAPPAAAVAPELTDLLVTELYDAAARDHLAAGGRVLLLAHRHRDVDTTTSLFQPVYWSGGWWGNRFSHLGGFCDPAHPAFAAFPTDGHADWSWHELMEGGALFDLRWAPPALRPLVQAVPDFHHDTRLGWVWQARVGPGRLLVSGFDLARDLERRPAARALRASLLAYAGGPDFDPAVAVDAAVLAERLRPSPMAELGARVIQVSAEHPGFEAAHLLDGDPATIWHTPWTGAPPPFPHQVVIELRRPLALRGAILQQRADAAAGGRLKRVRFDFAVEQGRWQVGPEFDLRPESGPQELLFGRALAPRFLRLTALESHEGRAWASLAELELLLQD